MALQLDDFKTRVRATWDAGDYAACSERIADVGELVAARPSVEPGMRVLDVACGTGNAAIPAARSGNRARPRAEDAGASASEGEDGRARDRVGGG
jgi:2-polyprenyl-3-methyl-5-hydroxy-6-metoxy-1,4-benzoquinol methylase